MEVRTIRGAGKVEVTANQAGNIDYDPAAPVSVTVIVEKAVLIVTGRNGERVDGEKNKDYGYALSGFVDGDTAVDAVTGKPSLTTTATEESPVGTYPIAAKPGTLASRDYEFSFKEGALTITPE